MNIQHRSSLITNLALACLNYYISTRRLNPPGSVPEGARCFGKLEGKLRALSALNKDYESIPCGPNSAAITNNRKIADGIQFFTSALYCEENNGCDRQCLFLDTEGHIYSTGTSLHWQYQEGHLINTWAGRIIPIIIGKSREQRRQEGPASTAPTGTAGRSFKIPVTCPWLIQMNALRKELSQAVTRGVDEITPEKTLLCLAHDFVCTVIRHAVYEGTAIPGWVNPASVGIDDDDNLVGAQ